MGWCLVDWDNKSFIVHYFEARFMNQNKIKDKLLQYFLSHVGKQLMYLKVPEFDAARHKSNEDV